MSTILELIEVKNEQLFSAHTYMYTWEYRHGPIVKYYWSMSTGVLMCITVFRASFTTSYSKLLISTPFFYSESPLINLFKQHFIQLYICTPYCTQTYTDQYRTQNCLDDSICRLVCNPATKLRM